MCVWPCLLIRSIRVTYGTYVCILENFPTDNNPKKKQNVKFEKE